MVSEENGRVLEPPNGKKVTNPDLYKALYDLEGMIQGRFNGVDDRLGCMDQRVLATDQKVQGHIDNHPPAKPNLARVGGITTIVATVVTAAVTAIYGLIKRGI